MRNAIPIFLAGLLLLVCSCSKNEITDLASTQGRIEVRFDWRLAPEADPAGMALFFYPLSEGGRIWRFDIGGKYGGPIEIPCGRYSMAVCNNDLSGVRIADSNTISSLSAVARTSDSGHDLVSTGMLYGASIAVVQVTPCGVSYTTPAGTVKDCAYGIVRCAPDSLATEYTVVFRNVKGLDLVREASARIGGVGSSIRIYDASVEGVLSSVGLRVYPDKGSGSLEGRTCAFAPDGSAQADYSLGISVKRRDGKTIARTFSYSELYVNTPSRHSVIIVADGLDIPEGDIPADPGAIDVGVDGWTVIEIDLDSSEDY